MNTLFQSLEHVMEEGQEIIVSIQKKDGLLSTNTIVGKTAIDCEGTSKEMDEELEGAIIKAIRPGESTFKSKVEKLPQGPGLAKNEKKAEAPRTEKVVPSKEEKSKKATAAKTSNEYKAAMFEGEKLFKDSKYTESLVEFSKALELKPKDVKASAGIEKCNKWISAIEGL